MHASAVHNAADGQIPVNRRDTICRRLILRQRRRYAEEGREWPGSQETVGAVTKYPNLLAELDASGKTLDELAGYARTSPEVMAEALESGGELNVHEIRRLAHNVGRLPPGYLADRFLHLVEPETNKGKKLLRRLIDTMNAAEGLPVKNAQQIRSTREALEQGKPVTYAAYRWAFRWLRDALERGKKVKARNRQIRTKRIQAIQTAAGPGTRKNTADMP